MAKKTAVEERLAILREKAAAAEKARVALEEEAKKVREEMAEVIPKIRDEVAGIDKKIADLQAKRSLLLQQLKLLGEKVKVRRPGKPREGGMRDRFNDLLRGVGVGATLTKKDITDHLGSVSGYVGMIIAAAQDAGYIEKTAPGEYKVTGIPA